MQFLKFKRLSAVSIVVLMMLFGCGKDKETKYVQTTATANTFLVEYVPGMMPATQGKSSFKIKVSRADTYEPVTGLTTSTTTLSVKPFMHMLAMNMIHSAPADLISEETNTPGTYDCTNYYSMPAMPGDGFWEVQVKVGTETTSFYPTVDMSMSMDSINAMVSGPSDSYLSMGMTKYKSYYLFNDSLDTVSATTPTLSFFISRGEDANMTFKPAYVGAVMGSPTGTILSMELLASLDSSFASGQTTTATHDSHGHWTIGGLSTLSSGTTNTIYLKLTVNGEVKSSGSKSYASYLVYPM
jgi:hypothetical protein